ncbi:MAG: hypothetical protein IT475_06310 [Aquimonas sp.]|nr:hypothetical protein [Aquimonas sp.]
MSIASVTPEHVEGAVYEVLWELLTVIEPLFGPASTARLLGLPEEELESWLGNWQFPTDQRNLARLSESVGCHAASLGAYVWRGDPAGECHPVNSYPEVHLLGQVVEAMADKVYFDTDRGGMFGTASPLIGENRPTDIVKWAVAGYIARARIDWLGGDITIEQLAALARVSEKTLRMAANPKNESALRITKRRHRTVITTDDAMEWLARRPDFIPTQKTTVNSWSELIIGGSASHFKSYLDALEASRPGVRESARESGLLDERIATLFSADVTAKSFAFTPEELLRFASVVGIEQPNAFARWVLELQHRERVAEMDADFRQQVLRLSSPESREDTR